MKIISINGQNVVGKDKKAVVGVMKTVTEAVPFVLAKPVPGARPPKSSVKMANAPPAAKAAASTVGENEIEVSMAPPLGISVNGDADAGVFITKVKDEGAAKASGVVEAGMKIISINGQNVVGKDKKAVAGVMKTVTEAVPFVLAKPVPGAKKQGSKTDTQVTRIGGGAVDTGIVSVSLSPPLGMSVNGTQSAGVFITRLKPGSA